MANPNPPAPPPLVSRAYRLANLDVPLLTRVSDYRVPNAPGRRDIGQLQPARHIYKIARTLPSLDFLRSYAGFGDVQNDAEWQPHRLFMNDNLGGVGCWVKRNPDGEIMDEIVIKELRTRPMAWDDQVDLNAELAYEAVIQRKLNQANSENITHLRKYTAFLPNIANSILGGHQGGRWRFYQEFAPYGTLMSLLGKYRYWHTFLPEAFLWHLFDSLAEAAEKMRDCSTANLDLDVAQRLWTNSQAVNFKITTDNIVMGYSDHRDPQIQGPQSSYGGTTVYRYPVIKLVGFGSCYLTSTDDVDNPGNLMDEGTAGSRPPEQTHYGCLWPPPGCGNATYPATFQQQVALTPMNANGEPNHYTTMTAAAQGNFQNQVQHNFHFLERLHVWAIGNVMFKSATLREDYWSLSTDDYITFVASGGKQIPDFDFAPYGGWAAHGASPYSKELMDLIRDCLNPNVQTRIDVAALRVRTRAGMQARDALYDPAQPNDVPHFHASQNVFNPKLYYRENEINQMPEGGENFQQDFNAYRSIQHIPDDPDWPQLRPKWARPPQIDLISHHEELDATPGANPRALNPFQTGGIGVYAGQLQFRNALGPNPPASDAGTASTTSTECGIDWEEFRLRRKQLRASRTTGAVRKYWVFDHARNNTENRNRKKQLEEARARLRIPNLVVHHAKSHNAIRRLGLRERAMRARPIPQ